MAYQKFLIPVQKVIGESKMKAFLSGHLLTIPFTIFVIGAGFGYSLVGAVIGLLVGLALSVYRYGMRIPSTFMALQLLGILIVVLLFLFNPAGLAVNVATALVFTFLAAGALLSVLQKKPWTGELSAEGMGDFAKNPAFIKANNMFSMMWAVIFAWFAFASWQEMPELARWIPLIAGGVISVVGPKILMRIGIKRGLFKDPKAHSSP